MPLTFVPEIAGYRRSYRPRGRLRPRSGLISRFTSSVSPRSVVRDPVPGRQRVAGALRGLRLDVEVLTRCGALALESGFDLRELGAEFGLDLLRGQRRHGRGARGRAADRASWREARASPGRVVAFERERPGGEDACAFAGGVRDRGRIAAGAAVAGGRARAPSCCGATSTRAARARPGVPPVRSGVPAT